MENFTNCSDFGGEETWRVGPFGWYGAFLCVLILIGIIGNSIVIYIQSNLSKANMGIATSTNSLIICLAVTDLLTAIFLIQIPTFKNIPNNTAGKIYCHFIHSKYMLWVSFRASVYTMTTIAIERFLAIVYPYTYKVLEHNHYVKYNIAAIWLCPLILRFPKMYFHVVGNCGRCVSRFPSYKSYQIYSILISLSEFFFPLIIILYTSIRTVAVLRRAWSGQDKRANEEQSTELNAIRRRFTITFIITCASFMLLWTPDQLGIFLYRIQVLPRSYPYGVAFKVLAIASLNAAIANPIIYSVCLPTFQRAIKERIVCMGRDKSQTTADLTTSIMSVSHV